MRPAGAAVRVSVTAVSNDGPVTLPDELAAAGVARGRPVALVAVPAGVALAWPGGGRLLPGADPAQVAGQLAGLDPRWTWWSARQAAPALLDGGVRPRSCWDLGAVGRLAHGLRRDDPAAVWAAGRGLPEPPPARPGLDLLDLDVPGPDLPDPDLPDPHVPDPDLPGPGLPEREAGGPVRPDGQLSREWLADRWAADLPSALRWAQLALQVQAGQEALLRALPDPRPAAGGTPLAVLTAYAESAAALLAVELERDGLPVDRAAMGALLTGLIGPRPAGPAEEEAARAARDRRVLQEFGGPPVDLRNPAQVRVLLARAGLDLPDTRSWRLEPHAGTSPPVARLLAWRKAERLATTYGWSWLDRQVGPDGRLRGAWGAADAAAGRMTAQAGLHNLPAELRPAVRAEPGCLLVRADLGQVEPRVLAAVSGDPGLARAAREPDLYAPVAAQLGCDRPAAKVAVLAAMYGQTSGTAGAALRGLDRAYPRAMAFLRAAEEAGRTGAPLRTHGGRLLRFGPGSGRFARNAVVQGAAAELFKAWAATVRAGLGPLGGQVVLCLHDELLLQVPAQRAGAAADLLRGALAATARWWAAGAGVSFVVEIGVGASWAEAHGPAPR